MMPDQPRKATSSTSCHISGCALPAVYTCARCGHLCCTEHVRHQAVERRVYRDETGYQPVLEHAPSRFDACTLCIRRSNKPFNGKLAQLPTQFP